MTANLGRGSDDESEVGDLDNSIPVLASNIRKSDKVDRYVGRRIRVRRLMLGVSQTELAAKIDVTYQQAHKYERGMNRVSAGRLAEVAKALSTTPGWFFEGYESSSPDVEEPKHQRLLLEMIRNFELIKDDKQVEAILQMARVMALTSGD
jgi:transcriptional regulator with XRE-family HTH domain